LRAVGWAAFWVLLIVLVLRHDQQLAVAWDLFGDRSPALYYAAYVLTAVVQVPVILLGLVLLRLLDRRLPRRFFPEAVWVMVSQMLVGQVLKQLFERVRPDVSGGLTIFRGPTLSLESFSFPSGHACAAFALAALLTAHYPRWRWALLALALATGLARVQLDRHFFSDIIAGGVVGWYWAWLVLWWLRRPRPNS
jgi:undecaprenyl-diphosphatase